MCVILSNACVIAGHKMADPFELSTIRREVGIDVPVIPNSII